MIIRVYDSVKVLEEELDTTPENERGYIEQYRKDGFVYGINEITKIAEDIETAYKAYQDLQNRYIKLTGKEHVWLK